MGYQGSSGLGPSGEGVWLPPQPLVVAPKHGQKPGLGHGDQSSTQSIPSTLDSSQFIKSVPASFTVPLPSTQIQSESTVTPTAISVDIMGTTKTSGPKRTLYIDAKKSCPGDQKSVKKQKVMTSISSTTSTTMSTVTVSPTIAHPLVKNPQNSPQTLVMGLGVGYPHGIGGSSYISTSATAISPFKHSIIS